MFTISDDGRQTLQLSEITCTTICDYVFISYICIIIQMLEITQIYALIK